MTKKVLFAIFALMFSTVAFAQHDKYGDWRRDEAGLFYLNSTSSNPDDDNFYTNSIWIGDNNLYLNLVGGPVPKEVGKDGKNPIVEIEMSFNNGEYIYFTFTKYTGLSDGDPKLGNIYKYVLYDRFKKTTVYDATNMLKQMANKQTLKVRYKVKNGSTIIQMFNLEGLDAILELLGK